MHGNVRLVCLFMDLLLVFELLISDLRLGGFFIWIRLLEFVRDVFSEGMGLKEIALLGLLEGLVNGVLNRNGGLLAHVLLV